MKDYTPELTPIQEVDGYFLKRDDLYQRAGIRGGKVRACWHLATDGDTPALGLITASARKSPQAQIVARLAASLGIPARCHMPNGAATEEMEDMLAHGAELVQHKAGYNNVLISRAKEDHKNKPGWRYIPFGMEDQRAVRCTREQVKNIPRWTKRIVIPVGSGMSAVGVLHGLRDQKMNIPVLGVRVGADPFKRLNRFGPFAWQQMIDIEDASAFIPYHQEVEASIGDILLDPIYEAKCFEYMEPGDLLWVVGIRNTAATR